ncbi:MAG: hypothetical protein E6J78_18530 [Deltaproteobacteria bacterium]|nr:MAG: hypothetical protein E6J78_18530 [Deltaproteobacteria bacterium]
MLKQHVIRLGLDTEFGIPLGNYADANSVGGGAVVTGEYGLIDMLSATMRIGFQAHVDRTIAGVSSHVNAIPVLFGAKYYASAERQGLFGAFEMGMFDLMSSVSRGTAAALTSNDVKFGLGLGLGVQQNQWNARVNVHSQDVGNFGSAMMITGGIGYQFAGL